MKQKGRDESYFLEYAMESCFHDVQGGERDYIYSNHRAKRLLKAGYLALAGPEHPHKLYMKSLRHPYKEDPSNIWYWPTEEGLRWWIGIRAEHGEELLREYSAEYLEKYGSGPYVKDGAPNLGYLLQYFDGKGIGGHVELNMAHIERGLVWIALREGLLAFVSHRDYSGRPHSFDEYLTVSLTKKGMAFFDAMPRLELLCA